MILKQRTPRLIATGCAAVLFATGCSASVSIGEKSVSKSKVEAEVARRLAERANRPEPEITCPGNLKAEVGAIMECAMVPRDESAEYLVIVTVTSAEDGDVAYDIDVRPKPVP